MKKISLKFQGTEIFIGNHSRRSFRNKREAVAFLNEYSKFLTGKLYQLRSIYIDLWNKYQAHWCYFDFDFKSTHKERIISSSLDASFEIMNNICLKSSFIGATYMSSNNLDKVCEFLIAAGNALSATYKSRRTNAKDLIDIQQHIEQLESISDDLSAFGKEYSLHQCEPKVKYSQRNKKSA